MLMQDVTIGDMITLVVVILAVIQLLIELITDLLKPYKKK